MEGRDHRDALPKCHLRRIAMQGVVVNDIEGCRPKMIAEPLEDGILPSVQRFRPVKPMPREIDVVVPVDDGVQGHAVRKTRRTVAAGKQRHVVAPRGQPFREVPRMRLHAPGKRRGDRMSQVGEKRDLHPSAAVRDTTGHAGCSISFWAIVIRS